MSQEKSWSFGGAFRNLFGGAAPKDEPQPITEDTWDDIETALITADFGPEIAEALIERLRADVKRLHIEDARELRSIMRDAIEDRLAQFDPTLSLQQRPSVILVVGVNGVGKTTTIGKLANYLRTFDKKVILGAADTFRAAAVEQLGTWAERAGADIVKPQQQGQDPASVAFQTVQRAIEGGYDIAIIDTAGRLQTKAGLMDELEKIRRVIEKQAEIAEVLLVLDATTGQNGLAQAEAFLEVAGVTGLVLTKLDGSARGGFVLAVQQETGLAIKLVGQGEGMNDLTGFTPHVFAGQLIG